MAKKEEYLLGKPVEAKPDESDVKKVEQLPGSTFLIGQNNLSSMANEEFNKMTNDPLMAMRAEEQKALQRLMANPVKMKQIRGAVEERQASLMADGASSSRVESGTAITTGTITRSTSTSGTAASTTSTISTTGTTSMRGSTSGNGAGRTQAVLNRAGGQEGQRVECILQGCEEADGGSGGGGVGRHGHPPNRRHLRDARTRLAPPLARSRVRPATVQAR